MNQKCTPHIFFLEMLNEEHKNGMSYRELAKRINENITNGLLESRQNKYSLLLVYSILQKLRFSPVEIKELLDSSTGNMENQMPPFNDDEYPVSRKKIISVLSWWRNKTRNIQRPKNNLEQFFTVQAQVKRQTRKGTES